MGTVGKILNGIRGGQSQAAEPTSTVAEILKAGRQHDELDRRVLLAEYRRLLLAEALSAEDRTNLVAIAGRLGFADELPAHQEAARELKKWRPLAEALDNLKVACAAKEAEQNAAWDAAKAADQRARDLRAELQKLWQDLQRAISGNARLSSLRKELPFLFD
jgi:hypothetical protein